MPTHSNPAIVWQRITTDISRLSNWAQRYGRNEQQVAVAELMDRLNSLAPHFDQPMISAKRTVEVELTTQQLQAIAIVKARGATARRDGLSRDMNPQPSTGPLMRQAWYDGWDNGD